MSARPLSLLVAVSLLALTAGCTSLQHPQVRADYYETLYAGERALAGDAAAFDRLAELHERWQGRSSGFCPWQPAVRRDARAAVAELDRVLAAREGIEGQRELADIMLTALVDLEAEYDALIALLQENDAAVPDFSVVATQKYLARRMTGSIQVLVEAAPQDTVEAVDTFGRDVLRFQRLLDAQVNGDEELGVEPPFGPEMEDSLAEIEDLFVSNIADSLDQVLENVVARHDAGVALDALRARFEGGDEPAPVAAVPDDGAAEEDVSEDVMSDEGAADDTGSAGDGTDAVEDEPVEDDGESY
jgi:hypothetical protein